MGERGRLFSEVPRVCPFLALDDDRDRRAEEPDAKHRCYAEPHPRPPALAHQRAYCLSPSFPGCPIFIDWAGRAAATPVPARPSAGARSAAGAPAIRADRAEPVEPAELEQPDRIPDAAAAASLGDPSGRTTDRVDVPARQADAAPAWQDPEGRLPSRSAGAAAGSSFGGTLSARSDAARAQARPLHDVPRRAEREVPAWERPQRHEAYPTIRPRARAERRRLADIPPLAIAAAALVLAALALFLLPGFFRDGGGDVGTSPSAVAGEPTAEATTPPSPTPPPPPTPVTYQVRPGDTMLRIAQRHGLTVEQIQCANGITNPNLLRVGQVLLIPDDEFECPAGGRASPSGRP